MTEIFSKMLDKFNSYEIFGNFLPGTAFWLINQESDLIQLDEGSILEKILIYYLTGLLVGRVGELFMKKMIDRTKENDEVEYSKYVIASEKRPFIRVLHETSICYRSMIGVFVFEIFVLVIGIIGNCNNLQIYLQHAVLLMLMSVLGCVIFILSYFEQERCIRRRIEIYQEHDE